MLGVIATSAASAFLLLLLLLLLLAKPFTSTLLPLQPFGRRSVFLLEGLQVLRRLRIN